MVAMKMAITIMPEEELVYMSNTIEWLQSNNKSIEDYFGKYVIMRFFPGLNKFLEENFLERYSISREEIIPLVIVTRTRIVKLNIVINDNIFTFLGLLVYKHKNISIEQVINKKVKPYILSWDTKEDLKIEYSKVI